MPKAERVPRVVLFDPWALVPYYTASLAQGLKSAGLEPVVASITYDLDPGCFARAGIVNDPGAIDLIGGRRIGSPALRRLLKLVQGTANLTGWLCRAAFGRRIDVFHVQQLRLVQSRVPLELWFLKGLRALGCRIVYTVHNLLPHDTGQRHRQAYNRLYALADVLICHSEQAASQLRDSFSVDPEKLRIIPHGPLFGPLAARPDDGQEKSVTVLFQGFLRPYKGIEFLLEGWREFESRHPGRARLVIAGSGEPEYVESLLRKAQSTGADSSIEFQSRFLSAEDVARLYRLAAIAVYPYREITTSGALMTAVANGKAVIATDLPGFHGILESGRNALLVPYADSHGLAEALRLLIDNPSLRTRLGTQLAALNEEFSWTVIGRKTRECYEPVRARTAHAQSAS